MEKKLRLDQLLVKKGFCESANKAKALIMSGQVVVNDKREDKPGKSFLENVEIRLKKNALFQYVSRGALKLKEALHLWPIDLKDAVCLDIGASTGGFTQVLLEAGAKKIYAVDVGFNQLHESLRKDERVINLEKTHILKLEKLDERPFLCVIDVSFISVKKILKHVLNLLDDQAYLCILVKPQFEVGFEYISKGGIVKNENIRKECLENMILFAKNLGLEIIGHAKSPILGTKGNVEFLLSCRKNF